LPEGGEAGAAPHPPDQADRRARPFRRRACRMARPARVDIRCRNPWRRARRRLFGWNGRFTHRLRCSRALGPTVGRRAGTARQTD
jgi:hypothetical protein